MNRKVSIKSIAISLFCILFLCSCASYRLSVPLVENRTYTISSRFDLQGGILNIPKNCTLVFKDGSIENGKVVCNNTTFKGEPIIEDLSGSITNDEFHSSWIKNKDKFPILCQIEAKKIVLDEDLLLRTHQTNDFKSEELEGLGHVIKIDYDLFELSALIRCFDNVKSIKNIHFDFLNHEFHSVALWFPHRTESVIVSNVTFANLDNSSVRKYGFEGLAISAQEAVGYSFRHNFEINLSKLSASNLRALTDNSGKEGEATMTIVYVNCNVPANSNVNLGVHVDNCDFKEIVVHNKAGEIIAHDAACIYVHQDVKSVNSRVRISNITGFDFGRRLIKTDGGNLQIENIRGESYNGGSMCMVGCNNGDVSHSANKATISGLTFKGRIDYVVACMVNNSVIKKIEAEFTDYIRPRVLSGVVFVGDDATCLVEDVNVIGKNFLYSSTSQTHVSLSNVTLTTDNSIEGQHYLFNTIGIKCLELSGFRFNINGSLPTITTYQNANPKFSNVNSAIVLRNGTINVLSDDGGTVFSDYSTRHPYSLSIENVIIDKKLGNAPVINISSPTLNSVEISDLYVGFEKTTDLAQVLNLKCYGKSDYSLSKIACHNKLKNAPITITGDTKSKVKMKSISTKGAISIGKNIQVINM